ncbi:MAG: hypothetical protein M3P29_05930 [Acidobacteriota bacterium]|nr:hypothetical protein [Acidobacteriota bacterium]
MKRVLLTMFVSVAVIAAEKPPAPKPVPITTDYNEIFKGLKFREIGPAAMGGRIDDFAVVESNPDIIYVGTASGGVFKTTNGGTTWEPVFDDQPASTIGDVTVAPSDPSIVWVGTGEANNRQSSSWGNGVYKSTDSGKTWKHMGLDASMHIGRIVISPADPNTVYVAAGGNLWGASKDRGVYKTTDGGKTWSNVLFVNEDTGASDIAMDPDSPGTLIAAMYQRRRTVFGYSGSGPGSGLYKTTEGGATWKKLEKGLPWDPDAKKPAVADADKKASTDEEKESVKEIGRIGVNFYRRNSNVVYALIEHAAGGIFRSDDKGETWTRASETNPRGIYYSQVIIDPNNDQRVWVHGAQMYYSEDGGKTFKTNVVQKIHGDYHAMWIDPRDSNHMIAGSDGGIYMSHDRGRSWDYVNNIPIAQFYEIGLDMQKPYRICGGLQDNNVWCGPSATFDTRGIANSDWFTVGGGDGFYAQLDPADPNTVYAESQDGNLLRRNLKTHESRSIRPPAAEGERLRFQWNSPLVVSAFDNKTIYYGGNYLFKSIDRGDTWTRLGNDLTNNQDRDKLPIMGRVPDKNTMSRHDGVQGWPAITTISESTLNRDLLYAGTDDGNLQVTRDGGKTWKNVSPKKGTYVSRVIASRFNEGIAYATLDGHRSNDFGVYVFMTTDYGETWKPIRNGLTDDAGTIHVIREHYRNPKLLFLGTERGLFISNDQGGHWMRLKLNLPTVPVDDIAIHPRENDLVLATHGRSIWILDDLGPLEQMTDATASEELHVFDTRAATEWRIANRGGVTGHKAFFGPNPPNGALITYFLKNKPAEKEKVKITVINKDGKVIRDIDGTGDAGINRVTWDLKTRSVTEPPRETEAAAAGATAAVGAPAAVGATAGGGVTEAGTEQSGEQGAAGGGGGGFGGFQGGLRVEPGEYTVKVAIGKNGKNEQSTKVVVADDPRIEISPEDRAARRQALTQLAQMAQSGAAARRSITGLHTALKDYKKTKLPENIQKAAEDLLKKVDEACLKLGTPVQCGQPAPGLGWAGPPIVYAPPPVTQRITQLLGGIENYASAPTSWQLDQIKVLQAMITESAAAAQAITKTDLEALNKMMREANVPYIAIPPSVPVRERQQP